VHSPSVLSVSGQAFTFAYDRALYAGGLTFAYGLGQALGVNAQAAYAHHPVNWVRTIEADERGHFGRNPNINEEDMNLLWGLSLERRIFDWPIPVKYITVLRCPILRFISILQSSICYAKGVFWEDELWGIDGVRYLTDYESTPDNYYYLERAVDRYADLYPAWRRTQFGELLGYVDYAGLEYNRQIHPISDDNDPFVLGQTANDVIVQMEQKFEDVMILELSEESFFYFGKKYKLEMENIKPMIPARHAEIRPWDEWDIPERILNKIADLVKDEMVVYNYFREKFECQFLESLGAGDIDVYLRAKVSSCVVGKLRRHLTGDPDPRYISRWILDMPEAMQYLQENWQRLGLRSPMPNKV